MIKQISNHAYPSLFSPIFSTLPILRGDLPELFRLQELVLLSSFKLVFNLLIVKYWSLSGVGSCSFLFIVHNLGFRLILCHHKNVNILFQVGKVLLDCPIVYVHIQLIVLQLFWVIVEGGFGQFNQRTFQKGLD